MIAPEVSPAKPDVHPGAALAGPGAAMAWRVHLAARHPGRAAVVVGLVLAAGAAAYVSLQSLALAAAASALLAGAVGDFLFPVTYRLSPAGAEARGLLYWRRIAWPEVKRVYTGDEEVKLSPLAHGGPREAFRGVLLRCAGNREAVLAAVERFRDAAPAS